MYMEPKSTGQSESSHVTGRYERRRGERVEQPYPTRVQGVDTCGGLIDELIKIDNISAGGLYMRLRQPVERGTRLSTVIRFATREIPNTRPPCLSVHGVVRRVDEQADGTRGVAVEFEHHVFF